MSVTTSRIRVFAIYFNELKPGQGSQTRGPWAAFGPPDVFVRPATSLNLFKLLKIIDKAMVFCSIKVLLASNCGPRRHFSS